jgi:CheY-like chemotaxis protein
MSEKPSYEELEKKIKDLQKQVETLQTDGNAETTATSLNEDTGIKTPKRILVVDDSEIDRMVLEEILKQAGYKVFLASDGKEGIELFSKNPIDLVITDMVMPEKMGIDLIMELREKYPDLKIIAMSAGGAFGPEIELDMASVYGGHTITKPFDPVKVLNMVNELLTLPPIGEEPSEDQSDIK